MGHRHLLRATGLSASAFPIGPLLLLLTYADLSEKNTEFTPSNLPLPCGSADRQGRQLLLRNGTPSGSADVSLPSAAGAHHLKGDCLFHLSNRKVCRNIYDDSCSHALGPCCVLDTADPFT